jgi:hypothetical protein
MSLSLFILLMTVTAEWDGSGSHLFWGNSILFFYSFLWKISCILISKIITTQSIGELHALGYSESGQGYSISPKSKEGIKQEIERLLNIPFA